MTEPMPMSVTKYEQAFAELTGVRGATAFAYSRHGLMAILRALGVQPGDEIILPPLTCKVVPLALLAMDVRPVYADISRETLNLDAVQVEARMSSRTRAVLFQHTYGSSYGIEGVAEVAKRRQVHLLEDRAQCTPHRPDGNGPTLHGRAAIFSNNLRKPLPAGSGGMVVTDDTALAEQLVAQRDRLSRRSAFAELALQAEAWIHHHVLRPSLYWLAYELNRKLSSTHRFPPLGHELDTEVHRLSLQISSWQERAGMRWLGKVPEIVAHRRRSCADYASSLADAKGIAVPQRRPDEPLYYFPVLVPDKAALLEAARRKRIELIAWPLTTPIYPVEKQEQLRRYGYELGTCPAAEEVSRQLVGLPTDLPAREKQRAALVRLLKARYGH